MRSVPSAALPAALTAFLAALLAVAPAAADGFNERFEGEWRGSGTVLRAGEESPRQVTCSVTGAGDESGIALEGHSRAMLIFTRAIGAELAFDPATNSYEGVYIGSADGPARLSGDRNGNAMRLDVRFATDIHGGTATMVIETTPEGDRFQLTMLDDREGRTLSDLTFERR